MGAKLRETSGRCFGDWPGGRLAVKLHEPNQLHDYLRFDESRTTTQATDYHMRGKKMRVNDDLAVIRLRQGFLDTFRDQVS